MKIVNKLQKAILLLSMIFLVVSCDEKSEEVVKLPTIYDIVSTDANFSILKKAIEKTSATSDNNSILNRVKGAGSYTVFAPTNASFIAAGITEASLEPLNPNSLLPADVNAVTPIRRILQNHILGVGTLADDLPSDGYVKTFTPGIGSTTLSMFVSKSSGVVLNGGTANGGATVTTANIAASNGVVHIIGSVLKLPTLVNHVVANPQLSTLLAVVTSTSGTFGDQSAIASALTNATSNPTFNATTNPNPSLTVFAPLNAAFTTATTGSGFLTGATVTAANVTKVLQYHVSRGNLTSSSATSWTASTATIDVTVTTLATPQNFYIKLATIKLFEVLPTPITNPPASNIKTVNIQATNGIIHTIDRVLQPVL